MSFELPRLIQHLSRFVAVASFRESSSSSIFPLSLSLSSSPSTPQSKQSLMRSFGLFSFRFDPFSCPLSLFYSDVLLLFIPFHTQWKDCDEEREEQVRGEFVRYEKASIFVPLMYLFMPRSWIRLYNPSCEYFTMVLIKMRP